MENNLNNFWLQLKKPILALAPMAGFTDSAFRQLCLHFGAEVVYSEMASATALNYAPAKTLKLLLASQTEYPYVIQLFGAKPKHFAQAVKLIQNKKQAEKYVSGWLKPAGFDINFGCPVPKVLVQGAGAALMDNLKLARQIIQAILANTNLPVSIKIRAQGREVDALKFLDFMSNLDIKAVMIHGRRLKQGFSGPVDWQTIRQARQYFGGIILANGGVFTPEDGIKLLAQTKADGLGIARGALGRPWIFQAIKNKLKNAAEKNLLQSREKWAADKKLIAQTAIKHARLTYKLKGQAGIIQLRKHLCYYVKGLAQAKKMRPQLVQVKSPEQVEAIFQQLMD